MKKQSVLRGQILKLLSEVYPDGIEQTSLIGIYHDYDKVDDVVKSAQYLADKEYVEKKEFPHPYKASEKVIYYKILPHGIDLIEGNIECDTGIIVPQEA